MPRQDIMYILYTKYLQTENKDWRNVFIFVSLLEALKLLLCTEVYFKLFHVRFVYDNSMEFVTLVVN